MEKEKQKQKQKKEMEGQKGMMQMVMLRSSDGQDVKVEKGAATMSQVIKDMLETAPDNNNSGPAVDAELKPIVLHNVKGDILVKVLYYCHYHFLTTAPAAAAAAAAASANPPSSSSAPVAAPSSSQSRTAAAATGGRVSGAQSSTVIAAAGHSSSTGAQAAEAAIKSSSSSIAAATASRRRRDGSSANPAAESPQDNVRERDKGFIQSLTKTALFNLTVAAKDLNIPSLLDLCCQAVADMIDSKSADDIRRIFNIENDFTPEEEAAIRNELQWAYKEVRWL